MPLLLLGDKRNDAELEKNYYGNSAMFDERAVRLTIRQSSNLVIQKENIDQYVSFETFFRGFTMLF